MLRYAGCLVVPDQKDWDKQVEKGEIRIYGDRFNVWGGFSTKFPTGFPCFYKYVDSWDSHSCGDWIPISKEEGVNKMVARAKLEIEDLTNLCQVLEKYRS